MNQKSIEKDVFEELRQALRSGGPEAAFERLLADLEAARKYQHLFEAMVMRSRMRLGLPLIQLAPASDLAEDLLPRHEEAIAAACRKVGGMLLADGDLVKAWPYLRAIGETASMAAAIEKLDPATRRKDVEGIIEIALNEKVHPPRGLELVVHHYGICNAITSLEQLLHSLNAPSRESCARVLTRTLYHDLVENIQAEVERREGKKPAEARLIDLIESRPGLFEGEAYYIDTSHLYAVVKFSSAMESGEDLDLAVELTEYGRRLSRVYHYESEPPFEDFYQDQGIYLRGLRGAAGSDPAAVERAASHFLSRARRAIEERRQGYPIGAALTVLARLDRLNEAIELAIEFESAPGMGRCYAPTVYELCQMAGDFTRLADWARRSDDPLGFAAGIIQSKK